MVRVDVMSLKGGAGKTTLAFRLARAQAQHSNKPVLIVDADLSGTCLGDLLEPWVPWGDVPNLVGLICDRPETLPERLMTPGHLPVYRLRAAKPASGPRVPDVVSGPVDGPSVLFCPSHVDSVEGPVEPPLLHALVAHESAGGWVQHVLREVVQGTARVLSRKGVTAPLGGVIVDHSPGMSALPWAILRALGDSVKGGRTDWKALFVTTPDLVDLKAWAGLRSRPSSSEILDLLGTCSPSVVNRTLPAASGRPDTLRGRLPEEAPAEDWLNSSEEIPYDEALARASATGGLAQFIGKKDPGIEGLRARLFDGSTQ